MGFIIHFYIIFGTNLLIGGPTQIAVFVNKRDPADLEWTSSNQQGGHEAGGAPTPLGAPSTLVGPP